MVAQLQRLALPGGGLGFTRDTYSPGSLPAHSQKRLNERTQESPEAAATVGLTCLRIRIRTRGVQYHSSSAVRTQEDSPGLEQRQETEGLSTTRHLPFLTMNAGPPLTVASAGTSAGQQMGSADPGAHSILDWIFRGPEESCWRRGGVLVNDFAGAGGTTLSPRASIGMGPVVEEKEASIPAKTVSPQPPQHAESDVKKYKKKKIKNKKKKNKKTPQPSGPDCALDARRHTPWDKLREV